MKSKNMSHQSTVWYEIESHAKQGGEIGHKGCVSKSQTAGATPCPACRKGIGAICHKYRGTSCPVTVGVEGGDPGDGEEWKQVPARCHR